jgi:hypothetical protein
MVFVAELWKQGACWKDTYAARARSMLRRFAHLEVAPWGPSARESAKSSRDTCQVVLNVIEQESQSHDAQIRNFPRHLRLGHRTLLKSRFSRMQ